MKNVKTNRTTELRCSRIPSVVKNIDEFTKSGNSLPITSPKLPRANKGYANFEILVIHITFICGLDV